MNLINLLCLTFLTTCACVSGDGTVMTTSDDISSTTDRITTDITPTEVISDKSTLSSESPVTPTDSLSDSITSTTISDKSILSSESPVTLTDSLSDNITSTKISDISTLSSEPPVTLTDSLSDNITSTTPSFDITTESTTETTTDVATIGEAEKDTKQPGVNNANPSVGSRSNFGNGSETPKSLEPSSSDKGHEVELLESAISGEEKYMKNIVGNESKVSKGKAAGILVASCILAVALIWISKIVYTRYQSRTYDVRQNIEMGNP